MISAISLSVIAWLPSESCIERDPKATSSRVGIVPIAVCTDVIELLQDRRTLRMHRLGDATEMRDHGIIVGAEVAPGQHRGRMHRNRLDHDHRGTADRPFAVVAEMPFAGQASVLMFAVCAPNTTRFRNVRCRSCNGCNRMERS